MLYKNVFDALPQEIPHFIPTGLLVTVPATSFVLLAVSVFGDSKFAVAVIFLLDILIGHNAVEGQSPPCSVDFQPVKTEPDTGLTRGKTIVPGR